MNKKIVTFLIIVVAMVGVVAGAMKLISNQEDTEIVADEDTLEQIEEIQNEDVTDQVSDNDTTKDVETSEETATSETADQASQAEETRTSEATDSVTDEAGTITETSTADESDTSNSDVTTETSSQASSSEDGLAPIEAVTDIMILSDIIGEVDYNFEDGTTIPVSNPESLFVLANKKNELAADYIPPDLIIPDVYFPFDEDHEKKYMREDAANALTELFNGALDDGLTLYAISGYRSYDLQERIYNNNVSVYGVEKTNTFSAKPGQSEHQTGLAMDISCPEIGYALETELGDLPEGIWVAEHAHEYGFIIRYLEDKVAITGYKYEPWHLRYVGVEVATYIYENEICFEEFYEELASIQ